jgi:hypothetical protein
MENHSKYTEQIYFEGADGSLYVNLFIPSVLNWSHKKLQVTQETSFPNNGKILLSVKTTAPATFMLRIRKPSWAIQPASVKVNGKMVKASMDANGYLTISRKWNNGDKIEADFPMHLYSESMPDNADRVAMLYGPIVLAGNLGDTMPDPVYGTPVLLTDNRNVSEWAVADNSKPLVFHMKNVGKPFDVTLSPFYQNTDNYYSVYWDYFTTDKWNARQEEYEAEKKRQHEIELKTVDIMRLGEMQPERDHNLKASEQSYASDAFGRTGREARKNGFFSFDMKVDSTTNALLCTYIGDDDNRSFDILIDDVKIASVELKTKTAGKFYDVEYPIPAELIKGKSKVVVRIQGTNGKTAGRVFGCRTMRK